MGGNSGSLVDLIRRYQGLLAFVVLIAQLLYFAYLRGQDVQRLDGRIDNNTKAIQLVQNTSPEQMRWELERQKQRLDVMEANQSSQLMKLGEISASLGLLNQKVEFLVETQKQKTNQQ